LVALYGVVLAGEFFNAPPAPDTVACAADAMQCPDGSYVGRSGPDCQFVCPTSTTSSGVPSPATVEAKVGKSATVLGIGILPLAVTEDSRCPVDVECVWAGKISVSVRIHNALGDSDVTMAPNTPVTTQDGTITLIDVRPAPHSGVKLTPADYVFVFRVAGR
jgi:hypothetical protein